MDARNFMLDTEYSKQALPDVDDIMKSDAYHPINCNKSLINHHHPFHNHLTTNCYQRFNNNNNNNNISESDMIDNIEWIKQFKQIPNTNIYIDAFECYATIKQINKRNKKLYNVHEILMNSNKNGEEIIFILTHFHWDNYRGLKKYHQQIFNKKTKNIIYCSQITAKIIHYKIADIYTNCIKILPLNNYIRIPQALPLNQSISILALDSNHIYGSIMCLFKIYEKRNKETIYHFYSGDFNINQNQHYIYNLLRNSSANIIINSIWMDTKSLSFWLQPVEHNKCLQIIKTNILNEHILTAKKTNNKIIIQIGKDDIGLENILIDIAKYIRKEFNLKLCLKQKDIDIIKICDINNKYFDLNKYIETKQQYIQNREKRKANYFNKLKKYVNKKDEITENKRLIKISNQQQHDLLFGICEGYMNENRSRKRFKNACSYCKRRHSKNCIWVNGAMYWIPNIEKILKMKEEENKFENNQNIINNNNDNNNNKQIEEEEPKYFYDCSWIECVNMKNINFENMRFKLKEYKMVIGIVISSKCQRFEVEENKNKNMKIYYIPYKQHASKQDLIEFIKILKPQNKIYPLNDNFNKKCIQRQMMQLKYDMKQLYSNQYKINNTFTLHSNYNQNINVKHTTDHERVNICMAREFRETTLENVNDLQRDLEKLMHFYNYRNNNKVEANKLEHIINQLSIGLNENDSGLNKKEIDNYYNKLKYFMNKYGDSNINKRKRKRIDMDIDMGNKRVKKRRIDENNNEEKYPNYYYMNDRNEWIGVYDNASEISENSNDLNEKYIKLKKEKEVDIDMISIDSSQSKQNNENESNFNGDKEDDESSENERDSFLEDDEKAMELFD